MANGTLEIWLKIKTIPKVTIVPTPEVTGWIAAWFRDYQGDGERRFAGVDPTNRGLILTTAAAAPSLRIRNIPSVTNSTIVGTIGANEQAIYLDSKQIIGAIPAADTNPATPVDVIPDTKPAVSFFQRYKKWIIGGLVVAGVGLITWGIIATRKPQKPQKKLSGRPRLALNPRVKTGEGYSTAGESWWTEEGWEGYKAIAKKSGLKDFTVDVPDGFDNEDVAEEVLDYYGTSPIKTTFSGKDKKGRTITGKVIVVLKDESKVTKSNLDNWSGLAEKIEVILSGAKKNPRRKVTGYELECPECGTVFERSVKDVGLEPFDAECPECEATVGSEFATPLSEDDSPKKSKHNHGAKANPRAQRNARTIGRKNIAKVKKWAVEASKKGIHSYDEVYNYVLDEIIENDAAILDTWESAHAEIENLVRDNLDDWTNRLPREMYQGNPWGKKGSRKGKKNIKRNKPDDRLVGANFEYKGKRGGARLRGANFE